MSLSRVRRLALCLIVCVVAAETLPLGAMAQQAPAQPPRVGVDYPEIRLPDGQVFKNARVSRYDGQVFHIEHAGGISKIPFAQMPREWQAAVAGSTAIPAPPGVAGADPSAPAVQVVQVLGELVEQDASSATVNAGSIQINRPGWSSGSNAPRARGRVRISPAPKIYIYEQNGQRNAYIHCEVVMTAPEEARFHRMLAPLPPPGSLPPASSPASPPAAQQPAPGAPKPQITGTPPPTANGLKPVNMKAGESVLWDQHGGPSERMEVITVKEDDSIRIKLANSSSTETLRLQRGYDPNNPPYFVVVEKNGLTVYWRGNANGVARFEVGPTLKGKTAQ